MKYIIRQYKDDDFAMLKSWWDEQNEVAPDKDLMPNSSFILEVEGEPIVSLSVFLTNVRGVCFLENFVGNPTKKGALRKECGIAIMNHAMNFAKELGYKRVVCFSYKDKIKKRYEDMGMTRTVDNLTSFKRDL